MKKKNQSPSTSPELGATTASPKSRKTTSRRSKGKSGSSAMVIDVVKAWSQTPKRTLKMEGSNPLEKFIGRDPKIVRVFWVDSTSMRGWYSHEEGDKFAETLQDAIVSVGFLLRDDPDNVTIYQSRSKDQKNAFMKIPKVAVLEIEEL